MRTAIYIEGDVMQLVLTPDNDWEKKALAAFHDKKFKVNFFDGAFYDCRGGWTRQKTIYRSPYDSQLSEDSSLIVRAEPNALEEAS